VLEKQCESLAQPPEKSHAFRTSVAHLDFACLFRLIICGLSGYLDLARNEMLGFSFSPRILVTAALLFALPHMETPLRLVHADSFGLTVSVVDDTAAPLPSAIVELFNHETGQTLHGVTDAIGRVKFAVVSGTYRISAEKKGHYPSVHDSVRIGGAESVEILLPSEQELSEQIDVVYSSARIDPQKTAAAEEISGGEILRIPFPASRDIRNALPLIAGAVQGPSGQVHFNGAAPSQTQFRLDGFKIGNPATGLFDSRVSADAVRAIQVQSARYSAEFGGAPGGVVSLISGTGDDRFRFSTTDFIPSIQSRKGIHLNNWTPRLAVSGPLAKGNAWFYQALDGELGLDVIEELPAGADRNLTWRVSSLTKAQVGIGRSHILTGTWLLNRFRADHAGLNPFKPAETTVDQRRRAYLIGIRDSSYLKNGMLVELAVGANGNDAEDRPMGQLPYQMHLEKTQGNFYRWWDARARRLQLAGSVTLPRRLWLGKHEVKIGAEVDRTSYLLKVDRRPIRIFDAQGELIREVAFFSGQAGDVANQEISGFFQDRWSLSDRLLLELGLRLDRDRIVNEVLWSPRVAASYLLTPRSRVLGGFGLLHESSNLDLLARAGTGTRLDSFFTSGSWSYIETGFAVDQRSLTAPRALSWNGGWEQQVSDLVLLNVEVSGRDGTEGWHYESSEPAASRRLFILRSTRRDTFRAFKVAASRVFKAGNSISASYTLASARSSDVLNPDVDTVIFAGDPSGPHPAALSLGVGFP
jgi:hypothetical protein